jgi:hypothetical protein
MSYDNLRTNLLQSRRCFRGLNIGAADMVTEINENFGNSAHTDAPDSDKMNAFYFALH